MNTSIENYFLPPCYYCQYSQQYQEEGSSPQHCLSRPTPMCKTHALYFLFIDVYSNPGSIRFSDGIFWLDDWGGKQVEFCLGYQTITKDSQLFMYAEKTWRNGSSDNDYYSHRLTARRIAASSKFYKDWFSKKD